MKDIPTFTINGKTFKFWHTDYEVGCGGSEIPMEWLGKHYLYVWNQVKKQHEYYCFESDLFMGETDVPWILKP
jgi:hypothetical protein